MMNATNGRRFATMLMCAPIVVALDAGCAKDTSPAPSSSAAAECIKVVDESGKTTDECLRTAPDVERVDLVTPVFSNPTPITNPLHPTSEVAQAIMGGRVDDKPFRTEVTLLPGTKPIQWHGEIIDTAIIQYVAYSDGRIHEVALDWYAQADDGSVWYFGEDVFNFENGKVADTKGTWIAGDKTPASMIMPAKPDVGSVYRPENAPEVVFEEVRVQKVDQTVTGPRGNISGAIEVMELHMDGTSEAKVFAPGYGEYSTGNPGGDLEAVTLAAPNDARPGPAPAEFGALAAAATGVLEATAVADGDRLPQAAAALDRAWEVLLPNGIPVQMVSQMKVDMNALNAATDDGSARSAALRIAQNELDLRLLYQRVIDVDLARLALWARQVSVDAAANDTGFVLADAAALDRIWDRTRPGVVASAAVDSAVGELRLAANAEDVPAAGRAAISLSRAIDGLRAR